MKYLLLSVALIGLTACDLSPNGLLGGKHSELVNAVASRPSPDWDCSKRWLAEAQRSTYPTCAALPVAPALLFEKVETKWDTRAEILKITLSKLADGAIPEISEFEYVVGEHTVPAPPHPSVRKMNCATVPSTDPDHVEYECFYKEKPDAFFEWTRFNKITIRNPKCGNTATYVAQGCGARDEYETFSSEVYIPNGNSYSNRFPTLSRGAK